MIIFFAEYIEAVSTRLKMVAVYAFMMLGFLIQLPSMLINYSNYFLFVKRALNLQEYLINFMPELSPIYGCWVMLVSTIRSAIGLSSLGFSFSPDHLLAMPVVGNFTGYGGWDLWWITLNRILGDFRLLSYLVPALLIFVASFSFFKMKNYFWKNN